MIKQKKRIKKSLFSVLKDKYPIDPFMLDMSYTPQHGFGDIALAFPFQLAKKLKRNPREIALEITHLLSNLEGVEKIEVAGSGYINLFLDRKVFFHNRLHKTGQPSLLPEESKIIIEHTNINPNKAAHIGHLRNAVLGDTLARLLRYKKENVEVQNYIDDTGVQVVDIIFGFLELEKKSLDDIKSIEDNFDYYCWDLYTRVSSYLEKHPETKEQKSKILKNIEEGRDPEYSMAFYISRRILHAHLKTMKRLDIGYDLLPCESSILHLDFWKKAFSLLKEKKAIYFEKEGDNKGCWVMPLEGTSEKEKIIVRSNGTVTYVGKDIAYQLWKFGLLEKDFYYQPFGEKEDESPWITTAEPNDRSLDFGKATRVYNVIDTRQGYLQKIVSRGLLALGHSAQAEKSIHFSYEMVALSPASLKKLNYKISPEDKNKQFFEVSGRKGIGVKADDFLDSLETNASYEVALRNPDFSPEQKMSIAKKVSIGALRYYMLKFSRNSLIIFDFDKALSFEGETGPYLQYTYVRIKSIFRKLRELEGINDQSLVQLAENYSVSFDDMEENERNDFWEIIFYASRYEEEIEHSIQSLELSHIAKFSFVLCQKFNAYYHKYSILAEKNDDLKNIRILTVYYVKNILKQVFDLMGIPIPERM